MAPEVRPRKKIHESFHNVNGSTIVGIKKSDSVPEQCHKDESPAWDVPGTPSGKYTNMIRFAVLGCAYALERRPKRGRVAVPERKFRRERYSGFFMVLASGMSRL